MSTEKIRTLNDAFRTTLTGGKVLMTAGVNALPSDVKASVIQRVMTFSEFNEENDPHGEHDFGNFTLAGRKFFFKLDYYDPNMEFGSENPSDPTKTTRALKIMLGKKYFFLPPPYAGHFLELKLCNLFTPRLRTFLAQ